MWKWATLTSFALMYISESERRALSPVRNPGRAPMKGAIMHFSSVTSRSDGLKGPLTAAEARFDVVIACRPVARACHYATHFAIYRRYAAPPSPGQVRLLTAFYCRLIRSLTARRAIDVRPSVRPIRRFNFYRTSLFDNRGTDRTVCDRRQFLVVMTNAISIDELTRSVRKPVS